MKNQHPDDALFLAPQPAYAVVAIEQPHGRCYVVQRDSDGMLAHGVEPDGAVYLRCWASPDGADALLHLLREDTWPVPAHVGQTLWAEPDGPDGTPGAMGSDMRMHMLSLLNQANPWGNFD